MTPFARNILALALFAAGWIASDWRHDSIELVAVKAAQESTKIGASRQLKAAEAIAQELSRLSANEKTIIKENIKLVERPVYRNNCLDADGVRNANAAKNGFNPAD